MRNLKQFVIDGFSQELCLYKCFKSLIKSSDWDFLNLKILVFVILLKQLK